MWVLAATLLVLGALDHTLDLKLPVGGAHDAAEARKAHESSREGQIKR